MTTGKVTRLSRKSANSVDDFFSMLFFDDEGYPWQANHTKVLRKYKYDGKSIQLVSVYEPKESVWYPVNYMPQTRRDSLWRIRAALCAMIMPRIASHATILIFLPSGSRIYQCCYLGEVWQFMVGYFGRWNFQDTAWKQKGLSGGVE